MAATAAAVHDAALVRLLDEVGEARAHRVPLEIRGGGTQAVYGDPPRGRPRALSALHGISSYEPSELVITARAGTPLAHLETALAERGQCLPCEPPRFAPGGTGGGMVAAGLSGPARAAAGSVRDHLLGATVLHGDGAIDSFGGQVIKNVAGYDVARLFAGSWGILGPLLEVSLKVLASPRVSATRAIDCDEPEALRRLGAMAAKPRPLSASAWHGGRLYLRFSGAPAAIDVATADCGGEAIDPARAAQWWDSVRDHRHEFFEPDAATLAGGECLWRLSVPANAALR